MPTHQQLTDAMDALGGVEAAIHKAKSLKPRDGDGDGVLNEGDKKSSGAGRLGAKMTAGLGKLGFKSAGGETYQVLYGESAASTAFGIKNNLGSVGIKVTAARQGLRGSEYDIEGPDGKATLHIETRDVKVADRHGVKQPPGKTATLRVKPR